MRKFRRNTFSEKLYGKTSNGIETYDNYDMVKIELDSLCSTDYSTRETIVYIQDKISHPSMAKSSIILVSIFMPEVCTKFIIDCNGTTHKPVNN